MVAAKGVQGGRRARAMHVRRMFTSGTMGSPAFGRLLAAGLCFCLSIPALPPSVNRDARGPISCPYHF